MYNNYNKIKQTRTKMSKKRDYNQIDALKYLIETGTSNINKWTGFPFMYHILSKIIMDGSRSYTKKELDELLEQGRIR